MITINKKGGYTIASGNSMEEWLITIKALVSALTKQDKEIPLTDTERYFIGRLIDDMLPDEDQIDRWEECLRKCA